MNTTLTETYPSKLSAIVLAVIGLGLASLVNADPSSGGEAQSIMFGDSPAMERSPLTNRTPAEQQTGDNHCLEMLQQIEELRGNPQRRFTAEQRYQAECQR